jgi:hypothetical protein
MLEGYRLGFPYKNEEEILNNHLEGYRLMFPFVNDEDGFFKWIKEVLDLNYRSYNLVDKTNEKLVYFQKMLLRLLYPEHPKMKEKYPIDTIDFIYRQKLMWHCGIWLSNDLNNIIINNLILANNLHMSLTELSHRFYNSDFEPIDKNLRLKIVKSTWFNLYKDIVPDLEFTYFDVRNIPPKFKTLIQQLFWETQTTQEYMNKLYYVRLDNISINNRWEFGHYTNHSILNKGGCFFGKEFQKADDKEYYYIHVGTELNPGVSPIAFIDEPGLDYSLTMWKGG